MNRVQQSFVYRYERPLLDWLCPRVPAFVTPDVLTAFGVFGAFVTLTGYALARYSPHFLWLASFGLVLHWLGDSLDGNLARYRKIERPRYGFFLDQAIDAFSNLLISAGMGLSPYVRMDTALFALTGYHMLTIYVLVRTVVGREFLVTLWNSGPTEMRLLIILMNTLAIAFGAPAWSFLGLPVTWCDFAVSIFSIGFIVAFLHHTLACANVLRVEDDAAREAARRAK